MNVENAFKEFEFDGQQFFPEIYELSIMISRNFE